jgi:hypothetical protein
MCSYAHSNIEIHHLICYTWWEELWWQSAWWIVSKFISPKKHNRGKPQWTGIPSIKDCIVHLVLPLLCLFGLRNVETIHYALCHRKFSYMIKQKFMRLCALQDPNMKMCTLKDVDSRVFTRMLRKDGKTDGSVTISLRSKFTKNEHVDTRYWYNFR